MKAFHSKEGRNLEDWFGKLHRNDDARHIAREVEWFANDIERYERRGMEMIEEKKLPETLPDGRNRRDLNRMEEDKMRSEGFHIDNDDIKDFAEDLEHIAEDVGDFLDPENPFTAEGIRLDAEVRFSAPVQKLLKMFMSDFGIKSEHDLERAVEDIAEHVERDLESCPYYRRARKATERMMRFAMKHL